MPCYSYGLPPEACKRGAVLRANVADSPCARCYSFRGRSVFPEVIAARQRRLDSLANPRWVDAMVTVIRATTAFAVPFFRWHDSGDIQNDEHFANIIRIAERLSQIQFWLPTQELQYAKQAAPSNLLVRASAARIGHPPSPFIEQVSSIAPKDLRPSWKKMVERNTQSLWYCPAELHAKYECGDCRACWDPEIRHVVYLEH